MKKHIFPIILIGATIIIWLLFYQQLPREMPIHWDINGNVNGYATKSNAMLMSIALMVFIYAMMSLVPKVDPKKNNYKNFSKSYSIINISTLVVIFAINMLMLTAGLGYKVNTRLAIHLILGVLFIVLGNYMPQIKPNYFIGVKTPWTLNDEDNWKKTHRFGGRMFIISGFLFMITIFLPNRFVEDFGVPIILIILLSPLAYSYLLFRRQING